MRRTPRGTAWVDWSRARPPPLRPSARAQSRSSRTRRRCNSAPATSTRRPRGSRDAPPIRGSRSRRRISRRSAIHRRTASRVALNSNFALDTHWGGRVSLGASLYSQNPEWGAFGQALLIRDGDLGFLPALAIGARNVGSYKHEDRFLIGHDVVLDSGGKYDDVVVRAL